MYQYATSIAGAPRFAERFLSGDDAARVAFLEVVKACSSDDPYAILNEPASTSPPLNPTGPPSAG